jgi:hypothetical protein
MTASPSNASVEGVLSAWTRRAVSTTRERHGGQCWKLSAAGNANVMSMSEPGQLPPRQVHGVGGGQRGTKDGRIREIGRHDELRDRHGLSPRCTGASTAPTALRRRERGLGDSVLLDQRSLNRSRDLVTAEGVGVDDRPSFGQ